VSKPKILLLDIETAPAKAYIWRMWDENISLDQLIEPGRIICLSAKWHGKREVMYFDERMRGGAKAMFKKIHGLMSEADAVITYNGDKFDLPKLNGAFVEYRIGPAKPVASIDLLKTVKKLGVQSNRLAYIAPFLKIGQKMKNEGFPLWAKWLAKDPVAYKKMRRYNMQDTRLLGGLYRVLRPYIKSHPYLRDPEVTKHKCSRCGSTKTQSRGYRPTAAYLVQRIQCMACGGWDTGTRTKVKAHVAN